MPLYGIDISHWQGTRVDLARVAREGFDFAIFKATDGSTFVDSRFAANLAAGRRAGLVVAAYHYQRGDTSAANQVANIRRVVPKDCPVIPDVENGGGGIALTRDIIRRLEAAGYTVPLAYVPRWYWQQIGSPSLAGLPPLWSSRYVNSRGYASEIYEDVPSSYWDGYGGNTVAVLQYSSSATVAGHTPVDVNAFRGTRSELAALFNEEDDMPSAEEIAEAVWQTDGIIENKSTPGSYWMPSTFLSHIEDTQDVEHKLLKQVANQLAAVRAELVSHDDPERLKRLIRESVEGIDFGDLAADEVADAVMTKLGEKFAGEQEATS